MAKLRLVMPSDSNSDAAGANQRNLLWAAQTGLSSPRHEYTSKGVQHSLTHLGNAWQPTRTHWQKQAKRASGLSMLSIKGLACLNIAPPFRDVDHLPGHFSSLVRSPFSTGANPALSPRGILNDLKPVPKATHRRRHHLFASPKFVQAVNASQRAFRQVIGDDHSHSSTLVPRPKQQHQCLLSLPDCNIIIADVATETSTISKKSYTRYTLFFSHWTAFRRGTHTREQNNFVCVGAVLISMQSEWTHLLIQLVACSIADFQHYHLSKERWNDRTIIQSDPMCFSLPRCKTSGIMSRIEDCQLSQTCCNKGRVGRGSN